MISQGNFIRGTIKATDFATVVMANEDETVTQYKAKDIQEFVWNGETYVSKPIVIKKKMEHRFFKLIEHGTVNLYAIGGGPGVEVPEPKRSRVRPSIGIGTGTGTGGFGGMGFGGGVSIGLGGGGRNQEPAARKVMPTAFFLEKPGTGPMTEIPVDGGDSSSKNDQIRNILLQKLTNDDDLTERIKSTENFDAKLVRAFVAAYNSMQK